MQENGEGPECQGRESKGVQAGKTIIPPSEPNSPDSSGPHASIHLNGTAAAAETVDRDRSFDDPKGCAGGRDGHRTPGGTIAPEPGAGPRSNTELFVDRRIVESAQSEDS